MSRFSIDEQIKEVERELKYRNRVYSHRIYKGKMTAIEAEHHTDLMKAVHETLKQVAMQQTFKLE